MKVAISMVIDCSAEHLWSFFEDLEKLKLWVPGFVELHLTSPPPHSQGSTYVMIVREGRRTVEYHGTNLVWEPERRIKEQTRGGRLGPGLLVADHRFTDLGGSTRLDYEHHYVVGGWRRLLAPLFFVLGRAYCRSMFRTLKEQAELSAAPGPR
ncbi:MAG: SRPBCC family protein [Planctomycetota bacterium]|jgi:carbon monoxide dehydrogenase subunit G